MKEEALSVVESDFHALPDVQDLLCSNIHDLRLSFILCSDYSNLNDLGQLQSLVMEKITAYPAILRRVLAVPAVQEYIRTHFPEFPEFSALGETMVWLISFID